MHYARAPKTTAETTEEMKSPHLFYSALKQQEGKKTGNRLGRELRHLQTSCVFESTSKLNHKTLQTEQVFKCFVNHYTRVYTSNGKDQC